MSKACLMLSLDFDTPEFFHFADNLDKSLLTDNEIEWYNHTTVLYGIDDPIKSTYNLAKLVNAMHMFPIKLGKISFFRTNPEFDVMKVDVESKGLHAFNHLVKQVVPYTNDYPDYEPHFTIAYVKKGAFKELEGCTYFEGKVFNPEAATFSYPDHSCVDIPFANSNKIKE